MKYSHLSVVLASLLCACVSSKVRPAHDAIASNEAFEALVSLAGTWQGTATLGNEQAELKLSYEVVSAGTTVMERLFLGEPHEMVTMYHKDGGRLLMTHYCAVGNQPRMELVGFSSAPETTLSFAFRDATNWGDDGQLIMHDMHMSKISDNHICSSWTAWKDGKPDHTANFDFQRESSMNSAEVEGLKALGYIK